MLLLDAPPTTYTGKEACEKLGISLKSLRHYRNLGFIPYVDGTQYARYPRDFIDGLAAKFAVMRRSRDIDEVLIELYCLHYQHKHPPSDLTEAQKARFRAQLRDRCEAMVERGSAMRLADLCDALGGHFTPQTVMVWACHSRVAAVRVGRTYYISRRHFDYQIWLLKHCLSVYDAANVLGMNVSAVRELARQGGVKAVKAPDGYWRLDPDSVRMVADERQRCKTPPPGYVAWDVVASELGVTKGALKHHILAGRVHSIAGDGIYFMRHAEVDEWKRRFNTLRGDFAWLDDQIKSAGRSPILHCAKRAHRILGLSESAFNNWCAAHLLPFYVRSFCGHNAKERYFVHLYLFGLARFMGGKPSIAKAREYKRLCAQAGAIV